MMKRCLMRGLKEIDSRSVHLEPSQQCTFAFCPGYFYITFTHECAVAAIVV
jgi:hypothetical protein